MANNEEFIKEIEHEAISARKMVGSIPADTYDWKPHEKSMEMKRLTLLVAQMFGWIPKMIQYPELDFDNAEPWASDASTPEEMVALIDANVKDMREKLGSADEKTMSENWVMRKGDTVLWDVPRSEAIRNTISHLAHHRGQLSVYMRLKDIPVPAMYGPTADDQNWEM